MLLALAGSLLTALPAGSAPVHGQTSVTVRYRAGWNLVGAPAGTRFSGVAGDLLTLLPGGRDYTAVSPVAGVESGRGYWAYVDADMEIPLASSNGARYEVDAPAGAWFMAGNPAASPARVTGADLVYSFEPAGGYTAVDLLPPGRGAFVYSAAGGRVAIAPAPDTIRSVAVASPPAVAPAAAAIAPGAPAQTSGAAMQIVASGLGQSKAGGPVVAGLLLRNTGMGALDLIPISITVYDASGAVIAAGETTLHYVGAGQTTGLAPRLKVSSANAVAARLEAHVGDGRPAGDAPPGALSFSQVALSSTRSSLGASALLASSFTFDLSEVHVSALVYDAAGAIIGGGETIKRLVPAGSTTGVVAGIDVSGTPARVEFYAQLP